MKRVVPRSLLGQTLLAIAAALFVAQAISAVLLVQADRARTEFAMLNEAAFRFVAREASPRRDAGERRGGRRGRRVVELSALPPVLANRNDAARAARLSAILEREGLAPAKVLVAELPMSAGVFPDRRRFDRPRREFRERRRPDRALYAAIRDRDGGWSATRVPMRERGGAFPFTIVLQTLLIFVALVAVVWLVLRRITRPLAALTTRVERFGKSPAATDPLSPSGPADIRALIEAHNAMENRIAALLDEKDVMLGAIGHDLKTPLAALRVRIESVEDDTQRARMADGIADITRSLDDILTLARVGRASEPPEPTQLAALVEDVAAEFADMGQPVEVAQVARTVAPVHVTWVRRALRNLAANAVRYGGGARLSLLTENGEAVLRVEDDGPGIPEDRIAAMLEPFQRGEASRNRTTGGAGLGLAIARAIAEQHGGRLEVANRAEGGLRAELRLPH